MPPPQQQECRSGCGQKPRAQVTKASSQPPVGGGGGGNRQSHRRQPVAQQPLRFHATQGSRAGPGGTSMGPPVLWPRNNQGTKPLMRSFLLSRVQGQRASHPHQPPVQGARCNMKRPKLGPRHVPKPVPKPARSLLPWLSPRQQHRETLHGPLCPWTLTGKCPRPRGSLSAPRSPHIRGCALNLPCLSLLGWAWPGAFPGWTRGGQDPALSTDSEP